MGGYIYQEQCLSSCEQKYRSVCPTAGTQPNQEFALN